MFGRVKITLKVVFFKLHWPFHLTFGLKKHGFCLDKSLAGLPV